MRDPRLTDWFKDAKWGVFSHYLGAGAGSAGGNELSSDDWNRRIDRFDVNRLADQLEQVGAGYYYITIGQNSGHFCSPNDAYDKFTGITPSKCSRRDLIGDLADALAPKGIPLMVYIISGAPAADPVAVEKLEWDWGVEGGWPNGNGKLTGKRLVEFQLKWEEVLREWSMRWGARVKGWWIDGVYFIDEMYRHPEAPNFQSLAAAVRAGNPDALVAYANGVLNGVVTVDEETEDYTSGELDFSLPTNLDRMDLTDYRIKSMKRWLNGKQYHVLNFLGEWWGAGSPRFPDELVVGYTKYVNNHEGVVTWDVPLSLEGEIPDVFMEQLRKLKGI